MATATQRRIVALDIEQNIAALKTSVDAVNTAVTAMELRDVDGSLPTDAEVKTLLNNYNAVSKPVIGMTDDLAAVNAVVLP